jgi:hypothetical protein
VRVTLIISFVLVAAFAAGARIISYWQRRAVERYSLPAGW